MAGILGRVASPPSDTLKRVLRPLTEAPRRAAIFSDVDGTLAPIVQRAEDAHVPEKTSRLLGVLGRRYGCVACVSGRSAAEARRLVGVGSIVYAGTHGAELLEGGEARARLAASLEQWRDRVQAFVAQRVDRELRLLRVRIEDKGAIVALHWRGVPDEETAHARLEGLAQEAERSGLHTHWGRKVLEIRPPVPVDKGQAVRHLVRRYGVRTALFGGDDATDLDGFRALDRLRAEGALVSTVKVGVRSDEGPPDIVERADLVVDGVSGFSDVLAELAAT